MFLLPVGLIYFATSVGGSRFAMSFSVRRRTFDNVFTGRKLFIVIVVVELFSNLSPVGGEPFRHVFFCLEEDLLRCLHDWKLL